MGGFKEARMKDGRDRDQLLVSTKTCQNLSGFRQGFVSQRFPTTLDD